MLLTLLPPEPESLHVFDLYLFLNPDPRPPAGHSLSP